MSVLLGSVAASGAALPIVTGGTPTSDATYYYHTFTANGTLTVSAAPLTADLLVVAGGGGGAIDLGGGGGAGGYRSLTSQTLAPGSFAVVVGSGGTAARQSPSTNQTNGNATSIGATSASGGGRGAGFQAYFGNGSSGGSGGGGFSYNGATIGGSGNAGGYSPVEGYAGGGSYWASNYDYGMGGGGGGAGGTGASSVDDNFVAISGGAGATWLNGTTYAAGGAGGYSTGANGTANRGNGGNAKDGYASTVAGAGGSGIVIVRYTRAQVGG